MTSETAQHKSGMTASTHYNDRILSHAAAKLRPILWTRTTPGQGSHLVGRPVFAGLPGLLGVKPVAVAVTSRWPVWPHLLPFLAPLARLWEHHALRATANVPRSTVRVRGWEATLGSPQSAANLSSAPAAPSDRKRKNLRLATATFRIYLATCDALAHVWKGAKMTITRHW